MATNWFADRHLDIGRVLLGSSERAMATVTRMQKNGGGSRSGTGVGPYYWRLLEAEEGKVALQMGGAADRTTAQCDGSKKIRGRSLRQQPPEAPGRGKAKVIGVGTPTSQDFEKLLKAYNIVKEGKRIADLEVLALRDRFEKAVAKLVRQGRTPRVNLTRRMYEATDDEEQEIHPRREEGLDDLTIRPSPPKRTSERLATKAAAAERAEFLKETKKYLKRLRKHGLQVLCSKEGITFVTCEQAFNDVAELRTATTFDERESGRKVVPDSEAEDGREEERDGTDGQETQPVNIDDEDRLADD
ncbi:hypothetical protein CBR_g8356 [Chara braunii]|uniref:Uncharacterized protein n=1 Tax=Chara braunii TaxID=69332 RepID=A0A388KLY8_CHABU|nr:hypothetical protein CBR_g8356 [Chara braunii]|eukprot:GBG71057.1 hypothetical protein CBR_g8356 [Chara braunii]